METIQINGFTYQEAPPEGGQRSCKGCEFEPPYCIKVVGRPPCSAASRDDNTDVVFVAIEKITHRSFIA